MLDQRVETSILRDDVKVTIWVAFCQLPDIERYMKIKGIWAIAVYLDILRLTPESLERGCQIQRYLGLVFPDEDQCLELLATEDSQVLWLNIFIIN